MQISLEVHIRFLLRSQSIILWHKWSINRILLSSRGQCHAPSAHFVHKVVAINANCIFTSIIYHKSVKLAEGLIPFPLLLKRVSSVARKKIHEVIEKRNRITIVIIMTTMMMLSSNYPFISMRL